MDDELTRDWNFHLDLIHRWRTRAEFSDLPSINIWSTVIRQQTSRHSLTTSSLHVIARWPSTDLSWPAVSLGHRIVSDSVRLKCEIFILWSRRSWGRYMQINEFDSPSCLRFFWHWNSTFYSATQNYNIYFCQVLRRTIILQNVLCLCNLSLS